MNKPKIVYIAIVVILVILEIKYDAYLESRIASWAIIRSALFPALGFGASLFNKKSK